MTARAYMKWGVAAIVIAAVNLFGYGLLYGMTVDACRMSECPVPWLTAFDVWLVVAGGGVVSGLAFAEWLRA